MKITREGNDMVVRIPLWQKSYDALGDEIGDVPNIIGVITGNECSISQLNDLAYKGSQQEGGPILDFFGYPDRVRSLCKEFDLDVWEHELCPRCKKPIRGVSTSDKEIMEEFGDAICCEYEWKKSQSTTN